jgi:DNA-binding transcriptional LysR family regulator
MARKPVEVRLVSLQSFLVCARLGNLANAAREMGLSRPALWQQIRGLEQAFDADFFHRRRYGVELTREGELLRDLVTPLLANFQGLRRSFDERRSRVPTVLRVACPDSIVEAEMVPVIGEFRRQAPSVTMQFLETWSEHIPGMVLAGEAELGIEACPRRRDDRLEYTLLFERPVAVAVPAGHPLERQAAFDLEALMAYHFVAEPPVSRIRQHAAEAIKAAGLIDRWQVALETRNEHFLLETVARDLAIAIVACSTRPPPPSVHILPANHLFGGFPVFMVRPRRAPTSEAEQSFCALLQSTFSAH